MVSAVAISAIGSAAAAQVSGAIPGQISQLPPTPVAPVVIPDIRISQPDLESEREAAGPSIVVHSVHITGHTLFTESELIAASGFTPDRSLSLSDLRHMARLITQYYNMRGYIVAQAYVSAQQITDGSVTIAVIEGHYGEIELQNSTNLRNSVATGILAGLDKGDVVASAPLERRLLLLSDLPGVVVHSRLSPGQAVGDTDLTIDLVPGPRLSGSVEADNAGNRYTGANRAGALINLNNPTGHGDQLSLRGLTSGSGLNYVRASYQTQLNVATIGVAYAKLWYELGKEFSILDATGTAEYVSLYGSYPLIRSRRTNLYLLANLEHRTFKDKVGAAASIVDRRSDVLAVGLSGDHRDRFGGGGSNSYSATWTLGKLDIQTDDVRAFDQISARTNGQYNKLAFSLARLQMLGGPFSLYGLVRGQVASKNLDISEKMELGGAYGVRAYPEGEAYGDQGYIATVEGRMTLPLSYSGPGRTQVFVFAETGEVDLVHSAWAPGSNSQRRSGGGVGVSWASNNNFLLSAVYAHRFGSTRATSGPDSPDRVWLRIAKVF